MQSAGSRMANPPPTGHTGLWLRLHEGSCTREGGLVTMAFEQDLHLRVGPILMVPRAASLLPFLYDSTIKHSFNQLIL